jgi:hypothetical protein
MERPPHIVPATTEIAKRFVALVRRSHLGQRSGPEELRELAGIPSVGLDARPRTHRRQRRRYEGTRDAYCLAASKPHTLIKEERRCDLS